MSQATSSQSEKSTQAHHEDIPKECQKDAHSKADDHDTYGLVKSRFDELGVRTTDEAGVRALDPTWLSTWSALLNVGQFITFTHISWLTDHFGRKASFYLARTWLVIVRMDRMRKVKHKGRQHNQGCRFSNTAKSPSVWALAKLCNGAGIGVLQYAFTTPERLSCFC
ncbi:hypothetical protein IFR04_009283 [Cadophora malorum]|uniref:MFS general substrate transporter n=1 Tax=Cadophora malorum TaxID=108018 RepID=A0A8H7W9H4_9HELO|nr:hypothetical protein IFR04_009283 [Cadophora malorum]